MTSEIVPEIRIMSFMTPAVDKVRGTITRGDTISTRDDVDDRLMKICIEKMREQLDVVDVSEIRTISGTRECHVRHKHSLDVHGFMFKFDISTEKLVVERF